MGQVPVQKHRFLVLRQLYRHCLFAAGRALRPLEQELVSVCAGPLSATANIGEAAVLILQLFIAETSAKKSHWTATFGTIGCSRSRHLVLSAQCLESGNTFVDFAPPLHLPLLPF